MRIYVAMPVSLYDEEEYSIAQSVVKELFNNADFTWPKGLYSNWREFLLTHITHLQECDMLVFFTDTYNSIGRGVWYEIQYMLRQNKPVFLITRDIECIPYEKLQLTTGSSHTRYMHVRRSVSNEQ